MRSEQAPQSLALVDMDRDGEIAAASRGWPRNDIGKRGRNTGLHLTCGLERVLQATHLIMVAPTTMG